MITYLYEYHNGQKGSNVGFIKVDLRGRECRLQLQVRAVGKDVEPGKVYLIMKGEPSEAVAIGDVNLQQGCCKMAWCFSSHRVMDSDYDLSQVMGVGILFSTGRYLASCWVDEPTEVFRRGTFREWKKQRQPDKDSVAAEFHQSEKTAPEIQKSESSEPEINSMIITEKQESEALEPEIRREDVPEPELQKAELQVESVSSDSMSKNSMEERGDIFQRINLNDIHRFPKQNWYLCKNPFLLHGYSNYNYLVLRKVEEEGVELVYLGVPGIYERPERVAALLLGFPEFIPAQETEQKTSEKGEGYQDGTFGYWCCLLDA